MRYLKTSEAAALLNVSPNTLRAWERRFGFPKPQRSPGKHRLYTHGEIAALRDALQEGLSISSAVSRAREGLVADTNSLRRRARLLRARARRHRDRGRARAALGRALGPGGAASDARRGRSPLRRSSPPQWAFAARWGNGWLRRAPRLVPPPVRPISIVLGDATRDELDPDAAYMRALELLWRARRRQPSSACPCAASRTSARRSPVHRPNVVVVAGDHSTTTRSRAGPTRSGSRSGRCRSRSTAAGPQRARACARQRTNVLPPGAGEAQRACSTWWRTGRRRCQCFDTRHPGGIGRRRRSRTA